MPENAKYVRSAYFHCWHFCDIGINRADFRSLGNRTLEAAGRIWKKRPYKSLPSIEHKVEAEFLRPVLLGESILPFRILREFDCVIPITGDVRMLDADAAAEHGYRGLVGWMRAAEALWNKYSKGKMSLVELFNFHNQLGAQFPIRQLRVVYSKAGTLPAATIVRNTRSVIENTLYWWGPNSEDEAYYLIAILNSETARARIENVQARGQFGARHFDKAMFNLPIPAFDATVALHANLARDSRAAEQIAAAIALPADVPFQRARKLVREELAADGLSTRINQLVEELLEVE